MAAPTRTDDQILHHRQIIAERYLRGDYQSAIARDLGISQQQVSYDLKAIRAQWLASSVRDFDAAKAQELARVDEVERAAWAGWTRSQKDKEIEFEEEGPKGSRSGNRKEGQSGNPAFLQVILSCISKRCEILGLDAPKRFVINWDELTPEQEEQLARGVPPEKVLKQAVTA
jgi:transposase-like protein